MDARAPAEMAETGLDEKRGGDKLEDVDTLDWGVGVENEDGGDDERDDRRVLEVLGNLRGEDAGGHGAVVVFGGGGAWVFGLW